MSGLAIWIEVCKYVFALQDPNSMDGIRVAVNTYFPAVGCTAAQQIFITEKKRGYLRSFGWAAAFCFLGLCILAFLLQAHHPNWSLMLGVICSLGAVTVWWIANGGDATFHDTDPDVAVGGSTANPLSGDTNGFTV